MFKFKNLRFTELDCDNYRPMAEFSKENIYTNMLEESRDMTSLSEKKGL